MDVLEPSLQALLAIERDCCVRLGPILEAERAAAAAYDATGLMACLKEREALQAEWQRAAGARRRRLRAEGRTLATLASADDELAAIVAEVRRQAGVVRRAQRINEGLVRAVLTQVSDLLAVMRRERRDSRYDGRAVLTTPGSTSSGSRWSA